MHTQQYSHVDPRVTLAPGQTYAGHQPPGYPPSNGVHNYQPYGAGYGYYDSQSYGQNHSSAAAAPTEDLHPAVKNGYNPKIHGDYDPNADYARGADEGPSSDAAAAALAASNVANDYTQTGTFNRFTNKFQNPALNPERYNDENKSNRQMSAFFDVAAASNSHGGRSLKAERSAHKMTKAEYKELRKRNERKKEEKRRALYRD